MEIKECVEVLAGIVVGKGHSLSESEINGLDFAISILERVREPIKCKCGEIIKIGGISE
jgi:hypothetical protein